MSSVAKYYIKCGVIMADSVMIHNADLYNSIETELPMQTLESRLPRH